MNSSVAKKPINYLKFLFKPKIAAGVVLCLVFSGHFFFLLSRMEHEQDFRWSVQYGWAGSVAQSSITKNVWLGQAYKPGRPVSRITVRTATYGKRFPGKIQAVILKGADPPTGRMDLWLRRVGGSERSGFDDGEPWTIELGGGEKHWSKGYYFLFRGLGKQVRQPFSLWLDKVPEWKGRQAELIFVDGGIGSSNLKPAGGHIALEAGYHRTPSLLQAARLKGRGEAALLYLACLGLGFLASWVVLFLVSLLLTTLSLSGRLVTGFGTSPLWGREIRLSPRVEWAENGAVRKIQENPRHLFFLFLLTVFVGLAVGLKATGLIGHLPASLRGGLGVVLFMIAPGFTIFSVISLFQGHGYSFLTMLLLSCSLGMSSNFVANVLVFAFPAGLGTVLNVYLIGLGSLFVLLVLRLLVINGGKNPYRFGDWPPGLGRGLLFWGGLASLFIIIVGFRHYPGLYFDELAILRKIAENQLIRIDNTAFLPDQTTTYLFIPFYLFLSLVARFSEIDVLRIAQNVWPMISLLSLLAVAKIVQRITGDLKPALVVAALGILTALAIPVAPSAELVLLLPTPDRYGVSAGLFIPLAIFHFLLHLGHRRGNVATFIGLVYLITEMSFIHSRETLFFLAFILIYSVIASLYTRRKGMLLRSGGVMLIVVFILFVYREVNLRFSPDLFEYVRDMSGQMWAALRSSFESGGAAALLSASKSKLPLFSYDLYRISGYLGYAYTTLAIGFLPLYALLSRRTESLVLAAAAASFGLFWMTDSLKLLIGGVVGSWFIFEVQSFLALLLLLVFADLVGGLLLNGRQRPGAAGRASGRGLAYWLVFAGAAVFAGAGIDSVFRSYRPYVTLNRETEYLLYFMTVALVLYKAVRRPPDREARATSPPVGLSLRSGCLMLAIVLLVGFPLGLFQGGRNGICGSKIVYDPHPKQDSSDISLALEEINQRNSFVTFCYMPFILEGESVTPEAVAFIRNTGNTPHVWLGSSTLPVILSSPQYSPVFTTEGYLVGAFIMHDELVKEFYSPLKGAKKDRFWLSMFWESEKGRGLLDRAVARWSVDRLIAGPSEYDRAKRIYAAIPSLKEKYDLIFDDGRFLIFGVKA